MQWTCVRQVNAIRCTTPRNRSGNCRLTGKLVQIHLLDLLIDMIGKSSQYIILRIPVEILIISSDSFFRQLRSSS